MRLVISILLCFLFLSGFSQNPADALRYSRLNYGGTARFISLGGAYGALGGDISALAVNPGGIGVFRKSEFTFTPALYNSSTETKQNGFLATDNKMNFNVGNIGYVFTSPVQSNTASRWVSSAFAIGYSRTASFHNRHSVTIENGTSSLLDQYANNLNALNFDPSSISDNQSFAFGTNLAWQTYLVDIDTLTGKYYHPLNGYNQSQNATITTKGSMGETIFSYGGNYDNKLYIGASVGFSNINYDFNMDYSEELIEVDTVSLLKSFNYSEHLKTTGFGVNAKIGAIYRANNYIRFGLALHSATLYSLNDVWSSSIKANYQTGNLEERSPVGNFEYSLSTPARAIASLGVLVGKRGLITAEYDYLNYGSARLRPSASSLSGSYNFSSENKDISSSYKSVGNLKLGGEWRVSRNYSLRGGFAYYADPSKKDEIVDLSRINYSAGLGFRDGDYFVDFAYILSYSQDVNQLYESSLISPTTIKSYANSFMVTFGFKY